MKSPSRLLLLALSLAVAGSAVAQDAQSDKKSDRSSRATVTVNRAGPASEKEVVTYLGVETAPVPRALAAHLGLPPDHGLTVVAVAENSPATGVLQQHDVIRKFEDQLLIDSRQLSVLIRARKPGDEVKLTIVRGGKEQVVTAKLGEREVARMFGRAFELPEGGAFKFFNGPEGTIALERLRELPGIAKEELNDVLRLIGEERGNWFGSPRVHVFRRGEKGASTILNLAEGNFVFSDDQGSVEIVAQKGDRQITVKDASGKVTFEGPINTDEQREKLPADVKERLKKIEFSSFEFEAGDELEQEGAALPEQPRRTKTSRELRGKTTPTNSARPF